MTEEQRPLFQEKECSFNLFKSAIYKNIAKQYKDEYKQEYQDIHKRPFSTALRREIRRACKVALNNPWLDRVLFCPLNFKALNNWLCDLIPKGCVVSWIDIAQDYKAACLKKKTPFNSYIYTELIKDGGFISKRHVDINNL